MVIPALNEEEYLPSCLESIVSQEYEGVVNVVVSDNESTDRTPEIAKEHRCFLVRGSKRGNIGLARKLGCEKARFLAKKHPDPEEIIVNTDADTILLPGYFQTAARVFQDSKVIAASGPFIINHPKIPLKKFGRRMIALHQLLAAFDLRAPWMLKKLSHSFLYGANSCLRRSLYEEMGGWDKQFGNIEDLFLTLKILKEGHSIVYVDGLRVETSLRKFLDSKGNLKLKALYNYMQRPKIRREVKLAREKKLFA